MTDASRIRAAYEALKWGYILNRQAELRRALTSAELATQRSLAWQAARRQVEEEDRAAKMNVVDLARARVERDRKIAKSLLE